MKNNKQEIIEFVKKDFNEIFKDNTTIPYQELYHYLYGSYGAQSIHYLNKIDSFVLEIIVHSSPKIITIPFNKMIEYIYLADRFELEGWVTYSFNADNILADMIVSPHTDGFYISITDANRQEIENIINTDYVEQYQNSIDFYNRTIEREKDLPEKPAIIVGEDLSPDEMMALFADDSDSHLYKSNPIKPKRSAKVDLTNFHLLETFT